MIRSSLLGFGFLFFWIVLFAPSGLAETFISQLEREVQNPQRIPPELQELMSHRQVLFVPGILNEVASRVFGYFEAAQEVVKGEFKTEATFLELCSWNSIYDNAHVLHEEIMKLY